MLFQESFMKGRTPANTIPYSKQIISQEDIRQVVETLKSDYLTQGPKIKKFENSLCRVTGAKYAVLFNSGTSALHGAYFALGIGKGDEVITTAMTFAGTSNAALYLGAKPVFVDTEIDNPNIDVSQIEVKITKKTKLIVPVHFSGHPVDLEEIHKIAKKHTLYVVEDACHALGAKYKKSTIGDGKYSDMTVMSFHPVKHITTGEGGVVLTNNKKFFETLSMFRTHGITKENLNNKNEGLWYHEMQLLGFNYRITDIQAALGISQLKHLEEFVLRRREIAEIYFKTFKDNPYFEMVQEKSYAYNSYHLFPILLNQKLVDKKKAIFKSLRDKGLWVQVHYIPAYLHPYYQENGFKNVKCNNAEEFYRREISIPCYPGMTKKDIDYTIQIIFETLKEFSK
jgi:UDP-4-amino-4,6-dideoxy-N-acetyl-beta-L-altrosamine transaminase